MMERDVMCVKDIVSLFKDHGFGPLYPNTALGGILAKHKLVEGPRPKHAL